MGRYPHHLCRYFQHRPGRRRYPDLGLQRREPGQHAVPGHAPDYDGPFRGRGLQNGPLQHRRPRSVSDFHHGHPDGGPVHPLQRGARGRYLGAGLPGRVPVRRSVGRDSRPGEGPAEHQRGAGVHHDQLDRRQPGDLDVRHQQFQEYGREHQVRLYL